MSNKIDVKKVANLAKLELSDTEESYFKEKFQGILDYFDILNDVNLKPEEIELKDESLQQIYREDSSTYNSIKPKDFSNYSESNFFKVPKIID